MMISFFSVFMIKVSSYKSDHPDRYDNKYDFSNHNIEVKSVHACFCLSLSLVSDAAI